MSVQPMRLRFYAVIWGLPVCLCAVGCGSSSAAESGVLSQAPTCPTGSDALKIEGSVAGGNIDDVRSTNINAGYENIGMPKFNTPVSGLASLDPNQLALTIDWASSLFNGQTAAITGGQLTLPMNHPDPGAQFCVSAGMVGFVDGGAEDGAFKFDITEVKAGADCAGAATPADLRGCYQ